MSRSEHHRTPLHHAAARTGLKIVRLLLDLGADPNATDAGRRNRADRRRAGENTDPAVVAMLQQAGAKLDFIAAVNLARNDVAEAMLSEDPLRIGPGGRDTIALHHAVSRKTRGHRALADRAWRRTSMPSASCGTAISPPAHDRRERGDRHRPLAAPMPAAIPIIRDDKWDARLWDGPNSSNGGMISRSSSARGSGHK